MIVSLRSPSSARSSTGLVDSASGQALLSEPVIRKFLASGSAIGNASTVVVVASTTDPSDDTAVSPVAGVSSGVAMVLRTSPPVGSIADVFCWLLSTF